MTRNSAVTPTAPLPLPQSLSWTDAVWRTDSPWDELTVRLSEGLPSTAYTLVIDGNGAVLEAGSEAAIADGRNTFAQLVADAQGEIPGVRIEDQPRYAWRGLTLDVARHWFPVEDILALLDAMALHRLNALHLHLTDDQGWRVEIPGYARLTEVGARRARSLQSPLTEDPAGWVFDDVPHEGSYSREDLERIVRHARNRGITLVPGVELPGHMQAALAAYPNLSTHPGELRTVREVWSPSDAVLGLGGNAFQFLEDLLTALTDIFPGPFVHIGGDDVPVERWESAEGIGAFLREHGLSRVEEVQSVFTRRTAEILREKGRRAIVWSGAAQTHLPDDVVVMDRSPQGHSAALAARGYQVIAAPEDAVSLDVYQASPVHEPVASPGLITVKDLQSELVPAALTKKKPAPMVLGLHAMLWTPYITTRGQMQRMLFPRLCSIAERAWGSPVEDGARAGLERLRAHLPRLDAFGIGYHPLD